MSDQYLSSEGVLVLPNKGFTLLAATSGTICVYSDAGILSTMGPNGVAVPVGVVQFINDLSDAKHSDDFSSLFVGNNAGGADNGLGLGNVGFGESALRDTIGDRCTAMGRLAAKRNIDGARIVAIGNGSAQNNRNGSGSVTIGDQAGFGTGLGNHSRNVIIGEQSATIIGLGADDNTIIGAFTAATLGTGARNILIGKGIDVPTPTTNDHLNIGGVLIGDLITKDVTFAGKVTAVLKPAFSSGLDLDSAQISTSLVGGLQIKSITGTINDLELFNGGPDIVMRVPTGTKDAVFGGSVSGEFRPIAGSFEAGVAQLCTNPVDGLSISGVTGTGSDLIIFNAAGTAVMQVPVGTADAVFQNKVSIKTIVLGLTETAIDGVFGANESIVGVTDVDTAPIPRTITLATAAMFPGKMLDISDQTGMALNFPITIDTEGAETINGGPTISIIANNGTARLYSDGSNWFTR